VVEVSATSEVLVIWSIENAQTWLLFVREDKRRHTGEEAMRTWWIASKSKSNSNGFYKERQPRKMRDQINDVEEQNKEVEISTGYRLPHCRDLTNLRFRIHAADLQTYGAECLECLEPAAKPEPAVTRNRCSESKKYVSTS
jgi:hypothetical protein